MSLIQRAPIRVISIKKLYRKVDKTYILEIVDAIRHLLTKPKSTATSLLLHFTKETVDKYSIYEGKQCFLPSLFYWSTRTTQTSRYTIMKVKLDKFYDFKLALKILPYRTDPDDCTQPENVEYIMLTKLYIMFRFYGDYSIHVPIPYTSFCCNLNKNPLFTLYLHRHVYDYGTNIKSLYSNFRLIIMEWMDKGTLSSYLHAKKKPKVYLIKSILFQFFMIMSIIRLHNSTFKHNQMFLSNILVTKQKTPMSYTFEGKHYYINNPKVKIVLNNLGMSCDKSVKNIVKSTNESDEIVFLKDLVNDKRIELSDCCIRFIDTVLPFRGTRPVDYVQSDYSPNKIIRLKFFSEFSNYH